MMIIIVTTVIPSSVGQKVRIELRPEFMWVVLMQRAPSFSSAMHLTSFYHHTKRAKARVLWEIHSLSPYLVFLSWNRVILFKLLSKLESKWEGFYEDLEGDGDLVLLLGDGDLWADGHHHLPGNERDTGCREKLLKVLIPVQMIRTKQLFYHGFGCNWRDVCSQAE